MSKTDMVRAYAESLLKQILNVDVVSRDQDGDYPVRYKSALYYVRVDAGSDDLPVVQVFAIALAQIARSQELFEELNTINSRLRLARIFWVADQVLIESEIVGEELSLAGFSTASEIVGGAADYYGPRLATKFGGQTAFADEEEDDYAPATEWRPGLYL